MAASPSNTNTNFLIQKIVLNTVPAPPVPNPRSAALGQAAPPVTPGCAGTAAVGGVPAGGAPSSRPHSQHLPTSLPLLRRPNDSEKECSLANANSSPFWGPIYLFRAQRNSAHRGLLSSQNVALTDMILKSARFVRTNFSFANLFSWASGPIYETLFLENLSYYY